MRTRSKQEERQHTDSEGTYSLTVAHTVRILRETRGFVLSLTLTPPDFSISSYFTSLRPHVRLPAMKHHWTSKCKNRQKATQRERMQKNPVENQIIYKTQETFPLKKNFEHIHKSKWGEIPIFACGWTPWMYIIPDKTFFKHIRCFRLTFVTLWFHSRLNVRCKTVIGVKLTEKWYFKTSNPFPSQCLCSLFTWSDVILHKCAAWMKTYFAYLKNCTAVGLQTSFFLHSGKVAVKVKGCMYVLFFLSWYCMYHNCFYFCKWLNLNQVFTLLEKKNSLRPSNFIR